MIGQSLGPDPDKPVKQEFGGTKATPIPPDPYETPTRQRYKVPINTKRRIGGRNYKILKEFEQHRFNPNTDLSPDGVVERSDDEDEEDE